MSLHSQEKTASVAPAVADVGLGEVRAKDVPAKTFNLWSTLGIAFSITSTPVAMGTYLSVCIGVGGSPVFFFAYLLAVFMDAFVCMSLAELASMYPHSSGQIHWTAVLAPEKYARRLSYVVGWLTSAGYFFWTAATILITSQLIWALVQICQATFVTHPWHFYVVYLAIGVLAMIMNGPLIKTYPYVLKGLVFYINAGALFILISLLVRTHPKKDAKFVFVDIVNLTGWSSNGVVFFLGLLPGLTAVNGFDSAAHMAEEVPNPAREVPQVMLGSALASAISGLPMILVYMFCTTNSDNLLAPVGGQPVAQLILDSMRSKPLTIICMVIFVVTFFFASCTMLTTWSRVWWSLSREQGTPFPGLMSKIDPRTEVPMNAVIFAAVACALIGLLQLGSNLALNAILGGAIICIFISYLVPISLLLAKRRRPCATKHYFDLGRAGLIVNGIACGWIAFAFVWLCFPLYIPYSNANMNWAIVVFAGIVALSALNWFAYSHKHFTVPAPLGAHDAPPMGTSIESGEK